MGPFIIALFCAIGAGAWLYAKMARKTGYGNEKSAYIGAGIATLVVFLVMFSMASMVL